MLKWWKSADDRPDEKTQRLIRDLDQRVEDLERKIRSIELDRDDLWAKVRRAIGRAGKVKQLDATAESENGVETQPHLPVGEVNREQILAIARARRGRH